MSQSIWKNKSTIAELSRISGLKYMTIYNRVKVLKWDKEIAISAPLGNPNEYKKILKKNGSNS